MTRWLLIVAAVLAWAFGLMLMFDTRAFEAPGGVDVTDEVAPIQTAPAIAMHLVLDAAFVVAIVRERRGTVVHSSHRDA